ncbi:MAG: hypothetical protein D6776_01700 [Planctomycetota bacterium]|nr:MAG: hypothetical protein D6776_01700 [Planctomycetota bacterium]
MDCRAVWERLDAFRDDELEPEVSAELDRHLERCATCRLERVRRDALEARVREAGRGVTPPPGLEARLRAALDRECGAGRRVTRWRAWRRSLAAAAVLLAVLLGVGLWPGPASADLLAHHLVCCSHADRGDGLVRDRARAELLVRTLGDDAVLPDLSRCGFRFVGARLCEVDGRPLVHLLYRHRSGKWLSVFGARRVTGFLRARRRLEHEPAHDLVRLRLGVRGELYLVVDPEHCPAVQGELLAQLR